MEIAMVDDNHRRLRDLLASMLPSRASDLHLCPGMPPFLRVSGKIVPVEGHSLLTPQDTSSLVFASMTPEQRDKFEQSKNACFCSSIPDLLRFRVALTLRRGAVNAVIKLIPFSPPTLESLGLPDDVRDLSATRSGLVVVGGPAGSGRTSVLAAMVDEWCKANAGHVLTIEDPVEFVFPAKQGLVTQMEIGTDVVTTAEALRLALVQDADVIMVGGLPDEDSIRAAIELVEAGRLVLCCAIGRSPREILRSLTYSVTAARLADAIAGVIAMERVEGALCAKIFRPSDDIRKKLAAGQLGFA